MNKIACFFSLCLAFGLLSCSKEHVELDPEVEKWKDLSMALLDSTLVFEDRGLQTSSYAAYTTAILFGWDDKRTQLRLEEAYFIIDEQGYGLGYSWDAFQDGTINDEFTNYTVTMADHVGYPFIMGYLSGAVPRIRLEHLVDKLLNVPYADSLNNCFAYSDNLNDVVGCVHNVNMGVGLFLERIRNLDFVEYDYDTQINSIIEREIGSYIPEVKNFRYWEGSSKLTDQNHLSYQAWCMMKMQNDSLRVIAEELIDDITFNRDTTVSSLIGHLRILPYNEFESDTLFRDLELLMIDSVNHYSQSHVYNMSNQRILSQLALWSAIYYEVLKKKQNFNHF